MSFFKKIMANGLGIGGAKVDTIIQTKNATPGGQIDGVIKIYAGQVEQSIKSVYIDVNTIFEKDFDDKKNFVNTTIQSFTINIDKTLSPNEEVSIPFTFDLDINCPITKGNSKVWLATRLDIENAIDNTDGDRITVVPNIYMDNILRAIENLGFRIKSIENIHDKRRLNNYNFIQEFEFLPTQGEFRGKLDELELSMIANNNGICVLLEVDRKVRGLGSLILESLSLDESHLKIQFTYEELKNYALVLNTLEVNIRKFS